MKNFISLFFLCFFIFSCSLAEGNVSDFKDVEDADSYFTNDSDAYISDDSVETNDEDVVYELKPVSFHADSEIRAVFLEELSKAEKTVVFSTFQFRDNGIMKALNNLHESGVSVKGVIGATPDEGLDKAAFPLVTFEDSNDSGGITHPKFMIIDERTLIITSANMAFQGVKNTMVIYRDGVKEHEYKDTLSVFMHEFNELFKKKSGESKNNLCSHGCDVEIGNLFFSPGAGCSILSSKLMKSESDFNYLALYHMTVHAEELKNALVDMLDMGADIQIILDDWLWDDEIANGEIHDLFENKGAETFIYDKSMVWHHKYFVNDNMLVFGSMNWTYSGCEKNDELFYISENRFLIEKFADYFERNRALFR